MELTLLKLPTQLKPMPNSSCWNICRALGVPAAVMSVLAGC